MKKFIEFVKTHKIRLLILLVIVLFFRSCGNSNKARKLEKLNNESVEIIDSLNTLIGKQRDTIVNFNELCRTEKLKIHYEYDNWISAKNRSPQLMELHFIVKNKLKQLDNK